MKSYIVVGLGRFGTEVACRLCEQGCEVLAVDNHPELIQQISDRVTHAVAGDARDKEVLKALGAKDFDCAIVAIGGSLADSVLATMNLKELGVPYVVCKAHDETHRQVLSKLGADKVAEPHQSQPADVRGRISLAIANFTGKKVKAEAAHHKQTYAEKHRTDNLALAGEINHSAKCYRHACKGRKCEVFYPFIQF